MVFVPNPFDTRFPMTAASKARYLGSVAKQKAWVSKIIVYRVEGIRGLDYPIKEAQDRTLRQVIVSATSELQGKRLFGGADLSWGCNANVAFQQSRAHSS